MCDEFQTSQISQLQLQRSIQERPALMHLHLVQPLGDLQQHLISSLQALAASAMVIQTTLKEPRSSDQPQPTVMGYSALALYRLSKCKSVVQHASHVEANHSAE